MHDRWRFIVIFI